MACPCSLPLPTAPACCPLQARERGGAIFLSNVHPARISAVNISGAEARDGGGIASQYGSMTIANGTIIRGTKVSCHATSPALPVLPPPCRLQQHG
jgi:hypothetical protein